MVIDMPDTRRLGRSDFCRIGDPLEHGNSFDAWTHHPLDEVLRPDHISTFLAPMLAVAGPGDRVDVYEVPRDQIETPDRDPLAVAGVMVTEIEKVPQGLEVRAVQHRPTLRFGPDVGPGIVAARWNNKPCVFRDGERVAVYPTELEALEAVEVMNGRGPSVKSARIVRPERKGAAGFEREAARPEDLAAERKGRVTTHHVLRTLHPIDKIIAADKTYFRHVVDRLRTADRLTIMRFENDAGGRVIEVLAEAVIDVDEGRVHLYPQNQTAVFGEPERGLVLEQTAPREWVVRRDGRTVGRFDDEQRAGWFLADEKGKAAA